jgi:hypothetical protein
MAPVIAEELLLLAYRPEGTIRVRGPRLDMALAGSLLAELALDGYIELIDRKVKATGRADGPEDPALASALKSIGAKTRLPDAVVTKLGDRVRQRLLADLVSAGVVDKRYRFFPVRKYPQHDPALREAVAGRLRAVVEQGAEPDRRTAVLATVIHAAKLGPRFFPDTDQAAVKARLLELGDGHWVAEAVQRAILSKRIADVVGITITAVIGWASAPG